MLMTEHNLWFYQRLMQELRGPKTWNGRLQRRLLDRQGPAVELTIYLAIVYTSRKPPSPNSSARALSAGRRVLRLPGPAVNS